jgi:hypothetical protein
MADTKSLEQLITKLKNLKSRVGIIADEVIMDNKSQIISLQLGQMAFKGEDSEGDKLRYQKPRKGKTKGVYSAGYSNYKSKRGGQTRYVDLKLNGDFYKSIDVVNPDRGLIKIKSEDDKFDILTSNFGDNILGLNTENLIIFANRIEPKLQGKVDKYLNL